MAITQVASTIICDAGPNVLPAPIDIEAIYVPASGSVTVAKGTTNIVTLEEGVHDLKIRSASPLTVTGACVIILQLSPAG